MQQSLEIARATACRQGRRITAKLGLRTNEMRAWRSLGRTMTDIKLLVFSLGRLDFRKKNLVAYGLDV